jgi:hypothetical protein
LTAATNIMANIIGGLSKIPLAKILDSWGRPQGMSLMLLIWVVGFIMMAGCNNVQTYAAAQVFSSVGYDIHILAKYLPNSSANSRQIVDPKVSAIV